MRYCALHLLKYIWFFCYTVMSPEYGQRPNASVGFRKAQFAWQTSNDFERTVDCTSATVQHMADAPKATAQAEAVNDTDQLELQVEDTESTLVAGDYFAAASKAEQLLGQMLYIDSTNLLQVRASFVLLQAKYELNR